MPIGKNALKRVTNNGYSNVAVSAPDMEHSTVEEVKEEPKKVAKAPKAAPKSATKSAPAKSSEKKPAAKKPTSPKVKPEEKADKTEAKEDFTRPDGFVRVALGSDMPAYLL